MAAVLGAAALVRLQRSVGNQAVLRLLAGGYPGYVQRKASKVAVPSGVFEAEHYEAFKTETPEHKVGAGIVLTFTPAPTFAEPGRIGLVQTIGHNDVPMWVDTKPVQEALGKDDQWRATLVTDSPVYAALGDPDKPPAAGGPKTLAGTPNPRETLGKVRTAAHRDVDAQKVEASNAYTNAPGVENPPLPKHKYQTGEVFGDGKPEPAALTDTPGFAASAPAAQIPMKWTAHVQALVLSGKSAGTYLGEVRWGWTYAPPGDSGQV